MTLQELTNDIHDNAVKHGWWEKRKPFYEVCALIHSEWSEALEEYRAGRPMLWFKCNMDGETVCDALKDKSAGKMADCGLDHARCVNRDDKPEGVAVELIDGCIRILDFYGSFGWVFSAENEVEFAELVYKSTPIDEAVKDLGLVELVNILHILTCESRRDIDAFGSLFNCFILAMRWVYLQGVNPIDVLMMKHRYNKTRSYRHGGKVC